MKMLIIAATKNEIEPLLNKLKGLKFRPDVLITGAGMVATTFHLTQTLAKKKYDAVINLGICGSFDRGLKIGEVVIIREDIFSELGAEDGDGFLKLSDMKLVAEKDMVVVPAKKYLPPAVKNYKKVRGITVNTVHGNTKSIIKVSALYKPDVESMEGAAFFYVCNQFKVPALALRAVSNYVERRNTRKWNIALAVKQLNEAAAGLFV